MLNGRAENGKGDGGNSLNKSQQDGNRDIHIRGIHLPVRKQGDGAFVMGAGGIWVKPFVQRWRGRHGIQQQDDSRQQRGHERLAVSRHLARYELHNIGKPSRGYAGRKRQWFKSS